MMILSNVSQSGKTALQEPVKLEHFINDFSEFIQKSNINVYRIAVMTDNGKAQVKTLQACNPCQNSYSVSKFFTLTAIGLLWDEGLIGMDEKLSDIFGDLCPPDMPVEWNDRTVEMAILHHCGLSSGYLDIDSQDALDFGKDYLSYVLSTPLGDPSEYSYTDAEFYLLSRVVSIRSGKPMLEYLWEKLFAPLEFREVAWSCCPMNHPMGATGLYIRTEDMVKLGALYLNNGMYNGHRILSEKWIDTVIKKEYLRPYTPYGYGHGGMRGQMLAVFSEYNLAVAWHGFHDKNGDIKEWIEAFLTNQHKHEGDQSNNV